MGAALSDELEDAINNSKNLHEFADKIRKLITASNSAVEDRHDLGGKSEAKLISPPGMGLIIAWCLSHEQFGGLHCKRPDGKNRVVFELRLRKS